MQHQIMTNAIPVMSKMQYSNYDRNLNRRSLSTKLPYNSILIIVVAEMK